MNKIQFSQKFKDFCTTRNLDVNLVYICQCALMAENSEECVSILLESLRSEDYDLLFRLVLTEGDDSFELRKDVPLFFMLPDEIEKKEKGKSWKDLTKALAKTSIEVTERFGYFFSPKDKLVDAKHVWDTNNYNLEKTVKVISKYYNNWSSEVSPMGMYSLLVSPQFEINYNNLEEEIIKPKYKGLR